MKNKLLIAFFHMVVFIPALAADAAGAENNFRDLSNQITQNSWEFRIILQAFSVAVAAVVGHTLWRLYKSSHTRRHKIVCSIVWIIFAGTVLVAAFVEVSNCMPQDIIREHPSASSCS
jgi:H+/Cl- antiporter ClcA